MEKVLPGSAAPFAASGCANGLLLLNRGPAAGLGITTAAPGEELGILAVLPLSDAAGLGTFLAAPSAPFSIDTNGDAMVQMLL